MKKDATVTVVCEVSIMAQFNDKGLSALIRSFAMRWACGPHRRKQKMLCNRQSKHEKAYLPVGNGLLSLMNWNLLFGGYGAPRNGSIT